jgi:hypothetical protein
MPISEQVMSIGDWSVTLRPDTPQSIREAIAVDWSTGAPLGGALSHIVITPAWVDVTNAGLDDAAILSAARYTGVVTRPGPQLTVGGPGLAWWMADADDLPRFSWGAVSAITWSAAYTTGIGGRFDMGDIASGGSFTIPAQSDVSRRTRLDSIAQAAGHEWRFNPDLTFDADTVANLYGTTPTVILIDGAAGRGGGLVGLEATFTVEEDWEQWADGLVINTNVGGTVHFGPTLDIAPSQYPTGGVVTKQARIDVPDVPPGFELDVANEMVVELNQPRFEISVNVSDRGLVDHVRCGDIVYVYDELQGLRDFDNQVEHNGRTVWPKIMRTTRMSWPVRQGMGVYWRSLPTGDVNPTYVDLTPYVQWEDGDATVDLIQGDAARYSLNPATGRVDTVGAAIERSWAQPWATYTPTITASGGGWALGNGTLTGAYRQLGSTLFFGGQIVFGSTTTPGTGAWTISLPSGVASAARRQSGAGWADNFGAGTYALSMRVDASSSSFYLAAGASGFMPTAPFTPGNQDTVAWSAAIELAP